MATIAEIITEAKIGTSFWDWNIGIVFGAIGVFITAITFLQPYLLNHEGTRNQIIKLVEESAWCELYRSMVNGILTSLQKMFGNALSFQAFLVCFIFAFIYPVIFFIFAISLNKDVHDFSGKIMSGLEADNRSWYLPAAIVLLGVIIHSFNNVDKMDKACEELAMRWFGASWGEQYYRILCGVLTGLIISINTVSLGSLVCLILVGYVFKFSALLSVIVFTLVFVSTNIIVLAAVFVSIGVLVGSFTGSFTSVVVRFVKALGAREPIGHYYGVFASIVSFLFIFGLIITQSFVYFDEGNYASSITFVVFVVFLPLMNATLDWLSWFFSRGFLKRASHEDSTWLIIRDIVVDMLLAIIFMILLCMALPIGGELVNLIYAPYAPEVLFDWKAMAIYAKEEPWGKGLMVSLMVVTTLLPTLLHIVLALVAVVMQSFLGRPFVKQLKAYEGNESNLHLLAASAWLMLYGLMVFLGLWSLYYSVMILFQLDITGLLYDLSMWGVAAVGLG